MIAVPRVHRLAGRLQGVAPERLGADPGELVRCLRFGWQLFESDAITLLVDRGRADVFLEAARRLVAEMRGHRAVAAVLPGAGAVADEDAADEAYQRTAELARGFCEAGVRLLFVDDPEARFPAGLQAVWNVAAFYRASAILQTRRPVAGVPQLALPEPAEGRFWQASADRLDPPPAVALAGVTTDREVPEETPPERLRAWVRLVHA